MEKISIMSIDRVRNSILTHSRGGQTKTGVGPNFFALSTPPNANQCRDAGSLLANASSFLIITCKNGLDFLSKGLSF